MWEDISDKDRLKLIMELINTAPNLQEFEENVFSQLEKDKGKRD